MKVKLLTGIAGNEFSYSPGDILELNDIFAGRLISSGQAKQVGGSESVVEKKTSKKKSKKQ